LIGSFQVFRLLFINRNCKEVLKAKNVSATRVLLTHNQKYYLLDSLNRDLITGFKINPHPSEKPVPGRHMVNSKNTRWCHKKVTKKIIKASIFLFLLITAASCGSNFLYNLIDNLLVRNLDQYFDLNKEQKNFLKECLKYELDLHRKTGIPEHIVFLKGIQARVEKGVKEEDVEWIYENMNKQFDLVMDRFSDDLVTFLMTLQPEQVDHFEERLAEQDREAEERRKKDSVRKQEDINEDTIESFENWFGPFTEAQQKKLLQLLDQMSEISEERNGPEQDNAERQAVRQNFIKALRREPKNREEVEKTLTELNDPMGFLSDEELTAGLTRLIIGIDRLITPEQRNHFIKKLGEWVDKMERLTAS
jgi:hypothetical protein